MLVWTSPWKSGGLMSSSLRFIGLTERSPVGAVVPFDPFVRFVGAAVEATVGLVADWVVAVGDVIVPTGGCTAVSNGGGPAGAIFSDG